MTRGIAVLLCALMLISGCHSWNLKLFEVPVRSSEYNATLTPVDISKPVVASDFNDLSRDEKVGVIVVVTVAIAAMVAGVVIALN